MADLLAAIDQYEPVEEKIWRERLATDDSDIYAFTPIEREGLLVLAARYKDTKGG